MPELMKDIEQRINDIDWLQYQTAYGPAEATPGLLYTLASDDLNAALSASHDLWCSLCHQHAYLSSAALPSYPILFQILQQAKDELKIEILDILYGFTKCSHPDFFNGPVQDVQWISELRQMIEKDKSFFIHLSKSEHETICDFATLIVEGLNEHTL